MRVIGNFHVSADAGMPLAAEVQLGYLTLLSMDHPQASNRRTTCDGSLLL